MSSKIVARIERELGLPGLAAQLAERLAGSDLQSLMLDVYRRRAKRRQAPAVLAEYLTNRFVGPSDIPSGLLARWERAIEARLPAAFEQIDLAPVAPLGSCSAVAPVTQHWAVATARNTEVVSDSTNLLALEAAVRRRDALRRSAKSTDAVHLAARHRLLRPQLVDAPDLRAHFALFALVSANRDLGSHRFELEAIREQIRVFVESLRAFLGTAVPVRVRVSAFATLASSIEETILAPLADGHPGVAYEEDPDRQRGRSYYQDVCFSVDVEDAAKTMVNVADGGSVPWTAALLSNRKERLVIGGIGSDMVCRIHARRATRDGSSRPVIRGSAS